MFDLAFFANDKALATLALRTCTKCGQTKPAASFGLRHDSGKPKGECRECTNVYARKWKSDTDYYRKGFRPTALRRYGLTTESYDAMFDAQNGKCAICGQHEQVSRAGKAIKLAVDHDHVTGKVRALLCGHCNRTIGLLQENQETLTKMAEYLRLHSASHKLHSKEA